MDHGTRSAHPVPAPGTRIWVATSRIPTAGTSTAAFSSRTKAEDWLMGQVSRHHKVEVSIDVHMVDEPR